LSKNCCAELELPVFQLAMADAQILTTIWKPKYTNLLLRQRCHLVWHTFSKLSFWRISSLSRERSYLCVSHCYLRIVFWKFWLQLWASFKSFWT